MFRRKSAVLFFTVGLFVGRSIMSKSLSSTVCSSIEKLPSNCCKESNSLTDVLQE